MKPKLNRLSKGLFRDGNTIYVMTKDRVEGYTKVGLRDSTKDMQFLSKEQVEKMMKKEG